jgi:hypothetical protein
MTQKSSADLVDEVKGRLRDGLANDGSAESAGPVGDD